MINTVMVVTQGILLLSDTNGTNSTIGCLNCSSMMMHDSQQQGFMRLLSITFSLSEREHIVEINLNKTYIRENKI